MCSSWYIWEKLSRDNWTDGLKLRFFLWLSLFCSVCWQPWSESVCTWQKQRLLLFFNRTTDCWHLLFQTSTLPLHAEQRPSTFWEDNLHQTKLKHKTLNIYGWRGKVTLEIRRNSFCVSSRTHYPLCDRGLRRRSACHVLSSESPPVGHHSQWEYGAVSLRPRYDGYFY